MSDFLKAVNERVVIYDGAMGTNIQFRNLTADDYWGKEGCNELLVLSRPDVIADIHAAFYGVGCDVVETDTFGSTRIVLAEYGLGDRTRELNLAACKVAREVAAQFSTSGRKRFVAGSIGPTTKLPSLGHITWDAMLAAYVASMSCWSRPARIFCKRSAPWPPVLTPCIRLASAFPYKCRSRWNPPERCCWGPKLARHSRPWKSSMWTRLA
jgi:methionine synthase I (cobalamin-dependent)